MNLLPHSNGVRKVKMKKERNRKELIKLFTIVIISIFIAGYIFQRWSNFIAGERLRPKVNYTTVNDMRLDYRISGTGKYTLVLDGAMGVNLETWTPLIEELEKDNVRVFVYNRRGYGYSKSGAIRTPEEQAQDLKILLRKAGVSEPYILVGEEYGSLVLTSFAEQFKDSVQGVVLIDPINENEIQSKDYAKSMLFTRARRKIESFGSSFGLTTLLDKLNLDVNLKDFESTLEGDTLEEFKIQRTKTSYTNAVYNELLNLINGDSNSQEPGVFSDVPYFLLTKDENDELIELGDKNLSNVHVTTIEKDFLSVNDTQNVANAIRQVIKKIQYIEMLEKQAKLK